MRTHNGIRAERLVIPMLYFGIALLLAVPALGDETTVTLRSWFDALREDGTPILYSSDLVDEALRVPAGDGSLSALREALAEQGLRLERSGQIWIVTLPAPLQQQRPARASDHYAQPIESTIVIGTRYHLPRERSPYATSQLTARDITTLPALAGDGLRAVMRLPGMADVGVSARPHVRGGLQDEMLIQLDGMELLDPYHLGDFQSPISTLDDRAIASMDVYTGGFPTRYGKRMSGVLDMSSALPTSDFSHEINASLYSVGANTRGGWGGEVPGEWYLSGRQGDLADITHEINSRSGKPKFWDLLARLDIDTSTESLLSLGVLATRDDAELRDDEETARSDVERIYLWARFEHLIGRQLHARWGLGWIDSDHKKSEATLADPVPDVAQTIGGLRYRQKLDRLALSNDYRLRLGAAWLEFGIQGNWARADYFRLRNFERGILGDLLGTGREVRDMARSKPDGWSGGVYASVDWPLNERLSVQPGLRWDFQDYSPGGSYGQTAPRIGFRYLLDDNSQLRLSLGRFYQAEEIHELQFLDGEDDFFRPQYADQAIFAYQWQGKALAAKAEAWYKRYRDQKRRYENLYNTFVLMPFTEPDRIPLDPRRARAQGVDLEISYRPDDSLSAAIHYSYLDAEDRIEQQWVPRRWSQRHTLGARTSWQYRDLTLSAALTWHSGWHSSQMPETIPADEQIAIAEVLNNKELREYISLDLGARWVWRWPAAQLTLHADLTNVLDRNNVAGLDYDIEEEDGEVSFSPNRDTLLPFIPSLGFMLAF